MSMNDRSSSSKTGEHRDALRGRAALPGAWHSNGESAASLGLSASAGGVDDQSEKLTDQQLMEMSRMRLEQKRHMPEEDPGPPPGTTPAEEYPIQRLQSRMSMLQDDITNQDTADQREKKERIYSCRFWAFVIAVHIVTAGVITGIVLGLRGNRSGGSSENSQVAPSPAPTNKTYQQRQSVVNAVYLSPCTLGTNGESLSQAFTEYRSHVVAADPAMQVSIDTANTTARAALCWLSDFDTHLPTNYGANFSSSPSVAPLVIQRFVLGLLFLHFFDAFDADTKLSWLTSSDACAWEGIHCEAFRDYELVTSIDLSNSGLKNNIPTELALLTNLEVLTLFNNDLTGAIPPLNQLEELNVDLNKLDGSMDALESMINLKKFRASYNQFQGHFPDIQNMTNLEVFRVSGILDVSGRFPNLSMLTDLEVLELSHTSLTGTLPNLTVLSNLVVFDIFENLLSGSMAGLTKLSSLTVLVLGGNEFYSTIPSELGMLQYLERIDFSSMALTGTIPSELGNLSSLQAINIGDNRRMSGSVPIEVCNLRRDATLIEVINPCNVDCDCCTDNGFSGPC